MSYILNNGEFRGDFGAGLVRAQPLFIGLWIKYVDHPIVNKWAMVYGSAETQVDGRASVLIRNADGRFGATADDSNISVLTVDPVDSLDGVWVALGGRFRTNHHVFVDGVEGAWSGITLAGDMRYLNIGRSLNGTFGLTNNEKVAHAIVLHFEPTAQDITDWSNGINPLTIWEGRSDFFYYPLTTESTTQTDASGNGGPTLTAAGTATFDGDDNPIIGAPPASGGTPPFVSVTIS